MVDRRAQLVQAQWRQEAASGSDSSPLRSMSVETEADKNEALFTEAFWKTLYRRAHAFVRYREDAEDLAQEAFLQLWKESKLGRRFEFLAAWLNTVLQNAAFGRIRKSRPDLHISFQSCSSYGADDENGGIVDLPDPAPSALDALIESDKREEQARLLSQVVLALQDMPEIERDCVMMCARGYSFVQIAKVLDLDYRVTIKTTRRAIAAIRARVEI
jgi:RNA polymerase sigma factor (sigma-70 family)